MQLQHFIWAVHKIRFYIPQNTCNLHYEDHVIVGNNQYLLCLVVQDQGILPNSHIRPCTNNSWNCQCGNFVPQEAWITELLRMYGPKDRKMASLSIPSLSGDGIRVSCLQICPHAPCVYYSDVQRPAAQLFHAGHRNNPLVVENACFFQYIYISYVSPHYGCQITLHLSLYVHVVCCPQFFGIPFLYV